MNIKSTAVPFVIGCLLAACVQQGVEATSKGDPIYTFKGAHATVYVYKDPHTGCEYLISTGYQSSGSGITPRISRYGNMPQGCGQ